MFFTQIYKYKFNEALLKNLIIKKAKNTFLFMPFGSTERKLEKYLKNNYNLTLRAACFYLLTQVSISKVASTEWVVTFKSDKADKLARLITFGNSTIKGCPIIKKAFDGKLY